MGSEGYPSRSDVESAVFRRPSIQKFRTFDELRHGFSNEGDTLGVGVCANGTNLSEQLLSALNRVCGENIFREGD